MTQILVAIITATVLCSVLFLYSGKGYDMRHMISAVTGIIVAAGVFVAMVFYGLTIWNWLASEHKVNIINREYGTNYTREEVFYASNVIDTIRQLDRKRVEINGDLLKDKK